jgi:hypothetical protein
MSEKSTKDGKTRTTRELLNGAFVAIPSNREALVLNSKALDLSTELTASAPTDPSEIGQLVTRLLIANGIRTKGFRADTKAVAGSYEQRQQALSDAIDSRYPGDDMYAWTLATFDYSVVYRVGGSSDLRGQWQCDYTYADDGTVELGEPTRVTMVEQVVPAAAAKSLTQDQDDQTDPAAADEPVTPAADEPAAEVTDEPAAAESDVDLQLRAFALSILAQSAD